MDKPRRILIIGAGASGMAAALSAARKGALVTVLEHNRESGKKLLITGNKKCNYTNTDISSAHYNCRDDKFISKVLLQFTYDDCIKFFKELGIEPDIRHYRFDDTGYVYPISGKAADLRDALYYGCLNLGVKFCFGIEAAELGIKKDPAGRFYASMMPGDTYDALVIASGSNAAPSTGSDSSVYPLLKSFRLGFKGFLPALCPLYSKDPYLKKLKGRRLDAGVRLITGDGYEAACFGEVQFNEHSISGIPVMQLSRHAAIALKNKVSCHIITGGHSFEIYRAAGFEHCQCCSGGIDVSLIDPATMMSLMEKNIYLCGEIIDVDGECGGYNLHFAWATGYIAGTHAAGIS